MQKSAWPRRERCPHLSFNLRDALIWVPYWAPLFDECPRTCLLPSQWRKVILLVIPKERWDSNVPSSWRGIADKSSCYKLFVTERLNPYPEETEVIPSEQHGFKANCSTTTACFILLLNLKRAIAKLNSVSSFRRFQGGVRYGTEGRNSSTIRKEVKVLRLLVAILQDDLSRIAWWSGRARSFPPNHGRRPERQSQSTAVLCAREDLSANIRSKRDLVKALLYAHDLVIYNTSRSQIEQALERLNEVTDDLNLSIKQTKTVVMKFWRGGASIQEMSWGLQIHRCHMSIRSRTSDSSSRPTARYSSVISLRGTERHWRRLQR